MSRLVIARRLVFLCEEPCIQGETVWLSAGQHREVASSRRRSEPAPDLLLLKWREYGASPRVLPTDSVLDFEFELLLLLAAPDGGPMLAFAQSFDGF